MAIAVASQIKSPPVGFLIRVSSPISATDPSPTPIAIASTTISRQSLFFRYIRVPAEQQEQHVNVILPVLRL